MKQNTARDFFLHLLSTVLLYMGVISLTILIFNIVNHYVPDVLQNEYYQTPADMMRFPVAMLIIVFPVFAWSLWYIRKLITKNPDIQNFKVRKWLMYLTVFVAAIIIIVTLINVVFTFLDGEFTLRFLLKILAILLISLAMFYYYLIDVREDKGKRNIQKVIVWAVSIVVVASIVTGFFAMGLPTDQREKRIDERRVEHLSNIYWAIQTFYLEEEELPAVLTDLPKTPESAHYTLSDPETGEAYEYIVLPEEGDNIFELCAVFTTEFEDKNSYAAEPYFVPEGIRDRSHPVGRHCYELEVTEENLEGIPVPMKTRF